MKPVFTNPRILIPDAKNPQFTSSTYPLQTQNIQFEASLAKEMLLGALQRISSFTGSIPETQLSKVDKKKCIQAQFEKSFEQYQSKLMSTILDQYYRTTYRAFASGYDMELQEEPLEELYNNYLQKFEQQKETLWKNIQEELDSSSPETWGALLRPALKDKAPVLDDFLNQANNDVTLSAYQAQNASYLFVTSESDRTCTACQKYDQQVIPAYEAQVGINFPMIHPNCKCTTKIVALPAAIQEKFSAPGTPGNMNLEDLSENDYIDYLIKLEQRTTVKPQSYNSFNIQKQDAHTIVKIDGENYRANTRTLQNVATLPDGSIINEGKLTEVDKKLLYLMKKRDEARTFSQREAAIVEAVRLMTDSANDWSIDYFREYSYYTLTEDVTKRFNAFMQDSAEQYKPSNNESIFSSMPRFYDLVRNGGPMDLKNQPEWQQSMYIYQGELVDLDALGNINYGYLGKAFGFWDMILLGAAGIAQIKAQTSDLAFIFSFGDDPRDQERVRQGMRYFNKSALLNPKILFKKVE